MRAALYARVSTHTGQSPEMEIAELRAQGISWRPIARQLGVGAGTVHRVAQGRSRKDSLAAPVSG